jgi:hypothetical protein
VRLADLELDLDVFAGPFDLLLTLILREEVDLLEVDLAQIVISYVDYLERHAELDLEATTEFLVLIAALLELKSRLMLPGEELEEFELDSADAAQELLARLLDAHRYRDAAADLRARLEGQEGYRFRSAPLPPGERRWRRPGRHTSPPCSPMRCPDCCAYLNRSTPVTWSPRASRSRIGWLGYGRCCGAGSSASRRRWNAQIGSPSR